MKLNMDLINKLAEQLSGSVKALLAVTEKRFTEKLAALEQRLAELPAPKDGAPGADGKDGAPGKDGFNGIDGKDGASGKDGSSGIDGKDGAPGVDGKDGAPGVDGKDGANGLNGKDGLSAYELAKAGGFSGDEKEWLKSLRGRDGADGKGVNGKDGATGKDGRDGRDGVDGKEGMSVFDIAVACGFSGTQQEWLSALRGKDGANGKDGINGKDGAHGRDGKDGRHGVDGKDGKDGTIGKDGADGKDGRDAVELEILDGVRPGRSYRRHTCVADFGGVLRAFRDTDPLEDGEAPTREKGWFTLMNGIAEESFALSENGRKFTRTFRYTDGTEKSSSVNVPAVLYRNVYREDGEYDVGDFVTLSGSVWHCNFDGTKGIRPGAGAKEWTLAVKSGRDGKDGKEAAPSKGNPPVSLK